jgi:hypothetical protein
LLRPIRFFGVICTLVFFLGMFVLNREHTVPDILESTLPQTEPAAVAWATAHSQSQPLTSTPEPQSTPRAEPDMLAAITRQPLPDIVPPPWADEMEGAILNYIAQRSGLELTQLQVQCAVEQCVIFLSGDSIPVYQMDFDVFASEHGFEDTMIYSVDGGPNRIVYLRR